MRIRKLTTPLIILIAVGVNVSSYIVGRLGSPPWMDFLGSVHYPMDYFYYLSFIAQGEYRWLTGVSLHTTESLQPTIIGWFYVVLGRLGYFLHLRPDLAYQMGVILFSMLYIISAYILIRIVFPKSKTQQTASLFLFLTANAFPLVFRSETGLTLEIVRPWFSYGNPFTRLTNVPSHLAIQALIISTISAASIYYQKVRTQSGEAKHKDMFPVRTFIPWSMLFFVLGMTFASLQPIQWLLVGGILGITYCVTSIRMHIWKKPESLIILFVPLALYGIGGAISASILNSLRYTYAPMKITADWESYQQQYFTYTEFLRINGPVWVIGILGLPFFIKTPTVQKITLFIYTTVSVLLFFSTIPQKLGIMNIRVLSTIPTLTMAVSATGLLFAIAAKTRIKPGFVVWLSALVITIPTLYTTWVQAKERASFDVNNAFHYLPKDTLEIFAEAKRRSTPDDTFLVGWPFNEPFPGFTGRRTYLTNFLATLNHEQKTKIATDFFSNAMSREEADRFLKENNIRYIIVYPIPHLVSHPDIKTVATSSSIYLFEYTGLEI